MSRKKPRGRTGEETRSPPLRPDTRAILEEMLLRCRDAAETCFTLEEQGRGYGRMEGFVIGTRLIKASLMLAAALEGPRGEFVHRILVEHRSEPGPTQQQADPLPHPDKNLKTIHRVAAPSEHKIE